MFDKLREHCGIFGLFGVPEASNLTYLGLHALQHRGQEAAGIVTSDGVALHHHGAQGLVADVFDQPTLQRLMGEAAIGHVRYSTAGGDDARNVQPFVARWRGGSLAVAHNGTLVNNEALRAELEGGGAIFSSSSDTETLVHLVARSRADNIVDRIVEALGQVRGAFSLVFLTHDKLIGVRDPHGFRPLVLGQLKGRHVLASETTALTLIEADYVREIEPGEMVIIDQGGLQSLRPFPPAPLARCVFEHVYFARPNSVLFGKSVAEVRRSFGQTLAREAPVPADVVIPVPDSGTMAAIGYSQASGIPFDMGLIRSHYVGRTFIEPQQSIRHFGVKLKLSAVPSILQGKRVVVVDDSIVRGTTSRKIVKVLRNAGATEVHMRISSPPTAWPCFYGVDTPNRQDLLAATHSIDEMAKRITADSLGFLSLEGMRAATGDTQGWCDACFSGKYPVEFRKTAFP